MKKLQESLTVSNNTTNTTRNFVTFSDNAFDFFDKKQIINVEVKEITVEITYRQASNLTYTVYPVKPAPDRVWKEVYGLKDGKITLLQVIQGKHKPAYHVDEELLFGDDAKEE